MSSEHHEFTFSFPANREDFFREELQYWMICNLEWNLDSTVKRNIVNDQMTIQITVKLSGRSTYSDFEFFYPSSLHFENGFQFNYECVRGDSAYINERHRLYVCGKSV